MIRPRQVAAWLAPLAAASVARAGTVAAPPVEFPRDLASYPTPAGDSWWQTVAARAEAEPFNLVVTGIFVLAVLHTFATPWIRRGSEALEHRRRARHAGRSGDRAPAGTGVGGKLLHLLGEVEAVFGLWAVVLAVAIAGGRGRSAAADYFGHRVDYTEAMFVVVIMALASTQPILRLFEGVVRGAARLGGGRPAAWWLALLTITPLLGSIITEPAAMTIAALLLGRQFFDLRPPPRLRYATLGLLFVNVSVGGTLTPFAAPPVLVVASAWNWDTPFMLARFGVRAVLGIVVANLLSFLIFRRDLRALSPRDDTGAAAAPTPAWITLVHLCFLAFTVATAHQPVFFVGGFLLFAAFARTTRRHQAKLDLRSPLLVGLFLAGLMIQGGLQGWWIEPLLRGLPAGPLFAGAAVLTAFNDNALVTFLATLVPDLTDPLKVAVVAGAVTGGGLTVIANAPNLAGQSLLQGYFPHGVSPLRLALAALLPTLVMTAAFLLGPA